MSLLQVTKHQFQEFENCSHVQKLSINILMEKMKPVLEEGMFECEEKILTSIILATLPQIVRMQANQN